MLELKEGVLPSRGCAVTMRAGGCKTVRGAGTHRYDPATGITFALHVKITRCYIDHVAMRSAKMAERLNLNVLTSAKSTMGCSLARPSELWSRGVAPLSNAYRIW